MTKHILLLAVLHLLITCFLPQMTDALAFDHLFDTAVYYITGDGPVSVASGDFDGDGNNDISVANYFSHNISIFLGNGDGTFASAVHYGSLGNPSSVISSDLNKDGNMDLAVADKYLNKVSVFLGNGDGTFVSAVHYGVGSSPISVTNSDFNDDGNEDLAVANENSNKVSILLGRGDGTFHPAVNYDADLWSSSVTSGDFDGDGDSDVAVANSGSSNVSILLGNGDGTFESIPNIFAGTGPSSVTNSDFDGDGDSDLAVANEFSNNVSIFLANKDGTFASAVHYGVGSNPGSVTSNDFDGDGDMDIVVAIKSSNCISVLLGNGDGTFDWEVNFSVGSTPRSVINSDFDGDGDFDLAVSNESSNDVSILLNLSNYSTIPIIKTINDIPNDQGKQVTVTWYRCGPDRIGNPITITEYLIYRKIDYNLRNYFESYEEEKTRGFVQNGEKEIVLLYPPGNWHYIRSVPSCTEKEYSAVVPTLADSTISEGIYYSEFFIRALTSTPGLYYDSSPDSGYSVDNLEPGVPEEFTVVYNTARGNQLVWAESGDEDFKYFKIYRSENNEFKKGNINLAYSTVDTLWVDTVDDGWKYYYKITALDYSGNESDLKGPDKIRGIEIPGVPPAYTLFQNYPNPFNPVTTICFDLPVKSSVNLSIYDVNGKRIKTLIDKEMTGGRKYIQWKGSNDNNIKVTSGVYFYRLKTRKFNQTKKMILMR